MKIVAIAWHPIWRPGTNIARDFFQDVLINFNSPAIIREYRLLWFKLRKLSCNVFSIFVRVVIVFAVFTTSTLTLSVYTVISSILNRLFHNAAAASFMSSVITTLTFHFSVYRSQMLQNSIGKYFCSNLFKNRRHLDFYTEDTVLEVCQILRIPSKCYFWHNVLWCF